MSFVGAKAAGEPARLNSAALRHVFLLVAVDEGNGVSYYARALGVHRWRMSRYLRDIGSRNRSGGPGLGLVTVEQDPTNPRWSKVVLTDKGRTVAEDVFRQMRRLSQNNPL